MFEWIKNYMRDMECDWETAAREYDFQINLNYDPEIYDLLPCAW